MEARGITMIDEIQGPPDWEGPDVLLRQTSFKALAEERQFRHADGSVRPGSLRVRFGEVEQRGVALTVAGPRPLRPDGRRGRRPPRRGAGRHHPGRGGPRGLAGEPAEHRAGAGPAGTRVLHLPGGRTPVDRPAQCRVAAGAGRGRRAGAGADRVRGLPAPLGGRYLPVEPDRRGHPRRRPARHAVRHRHAGRGDRPADRRPDHCCTRPSRAPPWPRPRSSSAWPRSPPTRRMHP